jgi:hypothetical protein
MSIEIEYDGVVFDFEDDADLDEALGGAYGHDWQEAAEALVAEAEGGDHGSAEAQAFENEVARLEKRIGRSVTQAELNRLINSIPEDGPLPDLTEKYGNELAERKSKSPESRRALMLERAEEATEQAEAEEADQNAHLSPAGNQITDQADE